MDWWLLFAVFLYFASALLILAEVFVPSGGLISVCSMACLVGGAVIFFRHSTIAGWVGVVIAVIMIPTVLILAYRMFPKTKFGKSVTLRPSQREIGDAIPDMAELKELMGTEGSVVSPLRPVGMCEISGKRVECVAESGYVDRGETVKVIDIEGTQVTVRVVERS